MRHLFSFIGILLLAFVAHSVSVSNVDDSDLSGPAPIRTQAIPLVMLPDQIMKIGGDKEGILKMEFLYHRHEKLVPISELTVGVGRQLFRTDENGIVKIVSLCLVSDT